MDITQLTQELGEGLIWFFTKVPGIGDAMALLLAGGLVVAAFIIIVWYWFLHHRPFAKAIKSRTVFLESIGCARGEPVDKAREAFSENYDAINKCMMEARHKQAFALRRAWEEYHDTIVNTSSEILHNAVRPEHFFLNLGERHRALNWFANIFIAFGLLVTFLGIIAALSTLNFSGGVDNMQDSLNGLMQVTGAKFWASVGGILASIILRAFDFLFSKKVSEGLRKLCDQLEHGMLFSLPQRIASDQLQALEKQSNDLRIFSEKIEAALDGAMEKQMMPMVTILGSIQQGIEQINSGSSKVVGEAIAKAAGAEMTGLAEAIAAMTASMNSMTERIAQQTSVADQQIEEAVRRFGQASEEMRTAFGELNRNFEAVSERMRADSEEASEQTRVRLGELLTSMGESLGLMRTQMAKSAAEFGTVSAKAAENAVEIAQEAIEEVFQSFVVRFKQVGQPLVDSMKTASGAISTSAYSLESSYKTIGNHARAIESAMSGSRDLVTSFATVANDVKSASEPVRQSAQSIERALRSVETLMTEEARSSEASRLETEKITAALVETASAAETAWREYRSRFAAVDQSLGEALNTLSTAARSHAENVNERIGQIDRALGDGIAQLAGALAPLSELRDTVEYLGQIIEKHGANIKPQKEDSE